MIVQLLLLQSLLTNSFSLDVFTQASELNLNTSIKHFFKPELFSLTKMGVEVWQFSQISSIKKSKNILDAVDVIIKDECPSLRVGLKLHFY